MAKKRNEALGQSVLGLLAQEAAGLSFTDIVLRLHLKGVDRKRLHRILRKMQDSGRIQREEGGRIHLPVKGQQVTARVSIGRSGKGILQVNGKDIVIGRDNMGMALPGDLVTVELKPEGESSKRGGNAEVLHVVERAHPRIAGTVVSEHGQKYLYPLSPNYRIRFRVRRGLKAQDGDRVLARVAPWENRNDEPEAEIVEIIGPESEAALDTKAVVGHYGFVEAFSTTATSEAEAAEARLGERGPRKDLTSEFILTIDPVRARDFDDALSIQRLASGELYLGVHIADVSHFVRPGDRIDEEALARGNSVYLPDLVIPMLPVHLSNGLCSLLPDRDRLTLSVFMTFDDRGNLVNTEFHRSVIRSSARLTYEQVLEGLQTGQIRDVDTALACQVIPQLRTLNQLAQLLRKQRMNRQCLDLDMPECDILVDPQGNMTGWQMVSSDPSHQLVEECMVAANRAVAATLSAAGYPSVYRIHGTPDPRRLDSLAEDIGEMLSKRVRVETRDQLARLLEVIRGDPMETCVRRAILRSMKRATYSSQLQEHYALAIPVYTHFTSPIRRYPDLIVHRQLVAFMSKKAGPHDEAECAAMADLCNQRERDADDAERDVAELKKLRFLAAAQADGSNRAFDALVIQRVNSGVFIELKDLQVQGFMSVRHNTAPVLRDKKGRGRQKKGVAPAQYTRGQELQVKPVSVDIRRHRVDLALANDARNPASTQSD